MAEPTLTFSALDRTPSLYVVVSERMLAAIQDSGLQPGSRLPSERELGDQFGVSRTVIREAVRHLAAKGVLDTTSTKGVLVAEVGEGAVRESLELFVARHGDIDPTQIGEVREALEVAAVRLAVHRATPEQLAAIRAAAETMAAAVDDVDRASKADVEFHEQLARATGNDLFIALVNSFRDIILRMREATLVDPSRGTAAAAEHLRIAEALERRDQDAAVAAMRDHLGISVQAYTEALGQA